MMFDEIDPMFGFDNTPALTPVTPLTGGIRVTRSAAAAASTPLTTQDRHDLYTLGLSNFEEDLNTLERRRTVESLDTRFENRLLEAREVLQNQMTAQLNIAQEAMREEMSSSQMQIVEQLSTTQRILKEQIEAQQLWSEQMKLMQTVLEQGRCEDKSEVGKSMVNPETEMVRLKKVDIGEAALIDVEGEHSFFSTVQKTEIKKKDSSRKMKIKPGKFDGTGSLEAFLSQFETCAQHNEWSESDKLDYLRCSLEDVATQTLWDFGSKKTGSYQNLIESLQQRFGASGQTETYRTQLRCRRQRKNEPLAELMQDIRRLMALAYPLPAEEVTEILAKDAFIDALADRELALKVRERDPKDLQHAYRLAANYESYVKAERGNFDDEQQSSKKKLRTNAVGTEVRSVNPQVERVARQLEQQAETLSSLQRELKSMTQKFEELQRQVKKCDDVGSTPNFKAELPRFNAAAPSFAPNSGPRSWTKNYNSLQAGHSIECYNCGIKGHIARFCRKPKQQRSREDSTTVSQPNTSSEPGITGNVASIGTSMYIKARICGRLRLCLIDSGSEVNLIPDSFIGGYEIKPTTRTLTVANGTNINLLGEVGIRVNISRNLKIQTEFLVSDQLSDIIIGAPWLKDNRCNIAFGTGSMRIRRQTVKLVNRGGNNCCRRVVVSNDIVVPARHEASIPAKIVYKNLKLPMYDAWATETGTVQNGVRVARTLLTDSNPNTSVRVVNTNANEVTLKKNQFISELNPVVEIEATASTNSMLSGALHESVEKLIQDVDVQVTEAEQQKLRELLCEYRDVFSMSDLDLGTAAVVQHRIDTGNNHPVRQPLRRQPLTYIDVIDSQTQALLDAQVIEPAASEWSSNVVLVKKKDGSMRFCIDYRHLNERTIKDSYALPRIDECLDTLKGATWFTTLDLRSGYHQVAMDPKDADKTAFVTRRGMYKFKKMPFGLCNAGATFQRLMDVTLSGLRYESCLVYLDDILVFANDVESHLRRLQEVFERLRSVNLKLKPSKCTLLQRRVEFLGYVVSNNGLSADQLKVDAVETWPVPNKVRDVRSFLGLCSYYRKFIQGFANVAAPLHALTQKNRKFEWTTACQQSFEELKRRLCSAPVLSLPRDEGCFILDTDASEHSIGAAIHQVQDGEEKVLAYASRLYSKAEKNYCTTRKELLAVVHFTKLFKQYLLGRKFIVRTDHAALQWLQRTPEPIGQQARWLERLQEFDYQIVHRPGRNHTNADALSRRPCRQCELCAVVSEDISVVNAITTPVPRVNVQVSPSSALNSAEVCESNNITQSKEILGDVRGAPPQYSEAVDVPACNVVKVAEPRVETTFDPWSPKELSEAQNIDSDLVFVKTALSRNEKPRWEDVLFAGEATKTLWHMWDDLVLINEVLYKKSLTGDCLIVVPRSLRKAMFKLIHEDLSNGHLGVKRTKHQLRKRAYWVGWSRDVQRFCLGCTQCATYFRGKPPKQGFLKPIESGEFGERLSIDVTGPHPKSVSGKIYILTMIDQFSKFVEAVAIPNQEAKTVARALMQRWILQYGVPVQILSDRGTNFESNLFQELCTLLGTDKVRTTAYEARTNGMIERWHRTLNSLLAKMIDDRQRNWCEKLPYVVAAYRATVHESTLMSPNFLIFGRENRAPVDLILGRPTEDGDRRPTYCEYVEEMADRMERAFALAREHLDKAAQVRKKRYDLRVKKQEFAVGEFVWYYTPRKYVGKSAKWSKNYIGPYMVVGYRPPLNYVLQKSRKSTTFIVHIDKLKKCYDDALVGWVPVRCSNEDVLNVTDDTVSESVRDTAEIVQDELSSDDTTVTPNTADSDPEVIEWDRDGLLPAEDRDEPAALESRPKRKARKPARYLC